MSGTECCSEVRDTLVASIEKAGRKGTESLSDQTSYEESKSLAFTLRPSERSDIVDSVRDPSSSLISASKS